MGTKRAREMTLEDLRRTLGYLHGLAGRQPQGDHPVYLTGYRRGKARAANASK